VNDGERLELSWIPLGAGQRIVRGSGWIFEALAAAVGRRRRQRLYHSALVAHTADGPVFVEMAPIPPRSTPAARGVVAEGAVGAVALGRFRVLRYEVRRWRNGDIPDLVHAVSSPVLVSSDSAVVRMALAVVAEVPSPTWGRDELDAGEMWNSNSVVSWVLTRVGVEAAAGRPPGDGRAPGWDAGVRVAERMRETGQLRRRVGAGLSVEAPAR
jgi:hypothetical protein